MADDTEERKKLRKNIIRREKGRENKGRKCKAKTMTRRQTNIYALRPWSRVVIEKVLVAEVVNKFIAIYVARQFIAARPMAVNSPSHSLGSY
jgi:hypothetical protein